MRILKQGFDCVRFHKALSFNVLFLSTSFSLFNFRAFFSKIGGF